MDLEEPTYTAKQIAEKLHCSERSIYRYLSLDMFENYLAINTGKRPRYIFPQASLDAFIKKHGRGFAPETRPKRAYHRSKQKGKHKKKGGKVA